MATSPLLLEVLEAMGRTTIIEAPITTEKGWMYEGLQWDDIIVINPAPNLALLILHELLHSIRPNWSERSIRRFATILNRDMSDEERGALVKLYDSRKIVRDKSISST